MSATAVAPHQRLEIIDVRENKQGVYYTLNERTGGPLGETATVTVKHSLAHHRFVCLSHRTADACRHADFVRQQASDLPRD